jgi:hypothetical protein
MASFDTPSSFIETLPTISLYSPISKEPGSSVSIVSDYGLDDRAIKVRSPAEAKRIFPVGCVSRPVVGPTQPPVQWVRGSFPRG